LSVSASKGQPADDLLEIIPLMASTPKRGSCCG